MRHSATYFTETAKDYARGESRWRKFIAETETKGNARRAFSHYWLGFCLEHELKYFDGYPRAGPGRRSFPWSKGRMMSGKSTTSCGSPSASPA